MKAETNMFRRKVRTYGDRNEHFPLRKSELHKRRFRSSQKEDEDAVIQTKPTEPQDDSFKIS
jgi:hypothetical protein